MIPDFAHGVSVENPISTQLCKVLEWVHVQLSDMRAFRLQTGSWVVAIASVMEVMVLGGMFGSGDSFEARRFVNRMMSQCMSSAARVMCWSWIESSRLACGRKQQGRSSSVKC